MALAALGRKPEAVAEHERAVHEAARLGWLVQVALNLNHAGVAAHPDRPRMLQHFERARSIAERLGLTWETARLGYLLGRVHVEMGNQRQAIEALEPALRLLEAKDAPRELRADVLVMLGRARWALREGEAALSLFQRALPMLREVGASREAAATSLTVAEILRDRGELRAALDVLEAAPSRSAVTRGSRPSRQTYCAARGSCTDSWASPDPRPPH